MDFKQSFTAGRLKQGAIAEEPLELIREMPLDIFVEDIPVAAAMRTPGHEKALAAGACVGEGILKTPGDLTAMEGDLDSPAGAVRLRVSDRARKRAEEWSRSRSLRAAFPPDATDNEIAALLCRGIAPFEKHGLAVSAQKAHERAQGLWDVQVIHRVTRSAHAIMVCGRDMEILSAAEDVGRHNALDKAIGMAYLEGALPRAAVAVLSCRMNQEVILKCAHARIPILVSVSRPTALAVHMARLLGMTLAISTRADGLLIFTEPQKLTPDMAPVGKESELA